MPMTFTTFATRTRAVSVFEDDPDALTIHYRVEVFNDDYRKEERQRERATRQRERERQALEKQIAGCDDDAQRTTLEDQLEHLRETHDEIEAAQGATILIRLIAEWDLYDDAAFTKMTPITQKTLAKLGGHTISRILRRITEDMRGTDPQNSPRSESSSSPEESAVSAPAGGSLGG